jgi:hypothetical protein
MSYPAYIAAQFNYAFTMKVAPQHLRPRWAVAASPEVSAQGAKHPDGLGHARRLFGGERGFMVVAVQGLPFHLVEKGGARMLRHLAPEHGGQGTDLLFGEAERSIQNLSPLIAFSGNGIERAFTPTDRRGK